MRAAEEAASLSEFAPSGSQGRGPVSPRAKRPTKAVSVKFLPGSLHRVASVARIPDVGAAWTVVRLMRSGLSGRGRCAAMVLRGSGAVGLGALALLAGGAPGALSAGPALQMRPIQGLGPAPKAKRPQPPPPSTAPCWGSSNWSGYALSTTTPTGLSCVPASGQTYTSVSGTWTVPTVQGSGTTNTYSAVWTGIDGFTNSNLIQAGTAQDFTGGSPHYYAWWEILPAAETVIPSITVQPGDSITVSIAKQQPSGPWTITVTDGAQTFTTTQSYSGPGTSAEWIVEAPAIGSITTLANYGSTIFDLGTANTGSPALAAGSGGEMVQGHGHSQQVVSIPSGPDTGQPIGDGFAVAYGSTAPAAPST